MMNIIFGVSTTLALYEIVEFMLTTYAYTDQAVNITKDSVEVSQALDILPTLVTTVALYEFIDGILPEAEDGVEAIVRYYLLAFIVGFTIGQALIFTLPTNT